MSLPRRALLGATTFGAALALPGLGVRGTQVMTPAAQLAFMLAERQKWGNIARAARVEVV